MRIHTPDPSYTASERASANFRLALAITLAFVGLLWLIQLSNWALDLGPGDLGVRPRELAGAVGILFAPLLHAGFEHLISNSLPLIVSGTTLLYLYPNCAGWVLPMVYVGPGVAVWLFGRSSVHLGASGLVYGLVTFILVAGVMRHDRRAVAASLLICFMYGTLVWGIFPIETGVSWETHLAAAVIGLVLAVILRHRDVPPPKRYSWEEEPEQGPSDDQRGLYENF
ncbi:MAG TPA: rhomboid family intramembrane serine protease [Burkholderiales bacterium]|nr:rhomboid family intramembrane serine protease [Burkholderiales bacterium]